jgi:hypothetical protein
LNIEGLKNKLGNNDFSALLAAYDVFGIAVRWAGFEKFDVTGLKGGVELRNSVEIQGA